MDANEASSNNAESDPQVGAPSDMLLKWQAERALRAQDLFAQLQARLTNANIKFKFIREPESHDELIFELPQGRSTRNVRVIMPDQIEALLAHDFENYRFIEDYAAIWSHQHNTISGIIETVGGMSIPFAMSRLTGKPAYRLRSADGSSPIEIYYDEKRPGQRILIGDPSPIVRSLCSGSLLYSNKQPLSISIQGYGATTHDQAKSTLEKLSSSLFFDIDFNSNLPFALCREARRAIGPPPPRRGESVKITYPKCEYSLEALSLYWYGRGAVRMPLLQILSYYQVVEFFYPAFSRKDVHRRIKNILREPSFNVHRDTDIARIMNAAQSTSGKPYGDERSQQKTALHECVEEDSLRHFIQGNVDRHKFFGEKSKILGLEPLPLKSDSDIRPAVADRIYDIRCKIVHTKNQLKDDGNIDIILPFSPAAEALTHDVSLMQFIARRVLIAASVPLQ